MATLADLQAQRTQILAEIQRRGGAAKAPNFATQLQQVDAQIRQMRGTTGGGAQSPEATTAAIDAIKNPATAHTADVMAAGDQAQTQIGYQNPTFNTPFGSQTTSIDPNTGMPTVTQSLDPSQQAILSGDQGLHSSGTGVASNLLNSGQFANPFGPQDFNAYRAQIEDSVFKSLTKDTEKNKAREGEQLSQTLANRGIPVGSELYNDQMAQFNTRYDDIIANAKNQASILGGQEMQTQFGVQQQAHQQNVSDLGSLSGLGVGAQLPNLPGFQAPDYQTAAPSELYEVFKSLGLNAKQINAAIAKLKQTGGGGGGGTPAEPPSPFNSGPPPGL